MHNIYAFVVPQSYKALFLTRTFSTWSVFFRGRKWRNQSLTASFVAINIIYLPLVDFLPLAWFVPSTWPRHPRCQRRDGPCTGPWDCGPCTLPLNAISLDYRKCATWQHLTIPQSRIQNDASNKIASRRDFVPENNQWRIGGQQGHEDHFRPATFVAITLLLGILVLVVQSRIWCVHRVSIDPSS